MSVTQDAYSRIYLPATSGEWTELLSGLGINNPSSWWIASGASGATLTDSGSGGRNVTIAGSPTLAASAPGFSATGIKPTDGSATMYGSFTGSDVNTTSSMLLQVFALNTAATAARGLNRLGTATAEHATLQSGNKLRATSNANTSNGTQQQSGVMVVVTKFDRSSSVLGVYTKWEQLKPTYSAPGASTTFYLFGDGSAASDATFVYGAYWNSTNAEISDSLINDLLEAVHGSVSTIDLMSAGSFAHKWVAAIEGCPYLLTDAPKAAVVAAYAGRDWSSTSNVLQGLVVELQNEQGISPFEAFTHTGRCTLRLVDDGTDTLGTFVARRQGGDETTLTASVDRNDTTIYVRNTTEFASSGTIYIGTEAISYTGKGATSFTRCTRGLYSPAGGAISGSAGIRFGNDHRIGTDFNHVQLNPVVSSIPRIWIGKRVEVRLHTWDEANQAINSRAEAQLVFPGRIAGISDDHNNVGTTVIELDHAMMDMSEAVVWKDPFFGDAKPGIALVTGRTFGFTEVVAATGTAANALTVVSGTPANHKEVKEGTYSPTELAAVLSSWLAGEKAAAVISGYYSLRSPVSNGDGIRTVCDWQNSSGTTWWFMTMPSEVAGFLGLADGEPTQGGASFTWTSGKVVSANTLTQTASKFAPFNTLIFRPQAARLGLEFSGSAFIEIENPTGTFLDQYANLPASIKSSCDSSAEWGLFIFDEKVLVAGSYDDTTKRLTNCWIAPFPLAGSSDTGALGYWGRRCDEDDHGPVKIRQILAFEGSLAATLLSLFYSTGTSGYNHSTYDTYGGSVGAGIPGEWLGPEFETSITNLPKADAPIMLLLDEPTKLSELIGGDLGFRFSFVRFKDGQFGVGQWNTPLNALSVATISESNKAGQSGDNLRVASQETNEHVRPVIKIDFCRDFGIGRNGDYLRSFTFVDQTAVDDAGGGIRPTTLKLRNTFQQHANAGGSVEAGLPDFMARMPCISRASRKLNRTLDHRYVESIAPGDIVTVTDEHARDPLTGARGVNSRAAFVTSVAYDLGGPSLQPGGAARPFNGEIEINFLDTQRGEEFAPSADIDETASAGGFSAGYNSGVPSIRCHANHYSHVLTIPRARGTIYLNEDADASHFVAGDKILIIERDPATTASPTYWERTILSVSGNDITLTATLSAPAWDSTKRYRVVPQKYSQVQTTQHEAVFQADATDEMVEDTEIPWHYSATTELLDFASNSTSSPDPGEFVPDLCFGDGRPYDVGHEAAIAKTINAFIDYKSAHQAPELNTSANGPVDNTSTTWATLFFGPMYLGGEHLSATVTRHLTVAPWFRSSSAGLTGKVRVTIMDTPPVNALNPGYLPGECFRDSIMGGKYAQSAEWSSTSTTWGQGASTTLSLGVKDIFFGFVYVLIEGTGYAQCRGLSECVEGPREVV